MVIALGRTLLVLAGSLILLPLVVSSPNGTFLSWPMSGSAISADVGMLVMVGVAVLLIHTGLRERNPVPAERTATVRPSDDGQSAPPMGRRRPGIR
jgi:hypothetical protein